MEKRRPVNELSHVTREDLGSTHRKAEERVWRIWLECWRPTGRGQNSQLFLAGTVGVLALYDEQERPTSEPLKAAIADLVDGTRVELMTADRLVFEVFSGPGQYEIGG